MDDLVWNQNGATATDGVSPRRLKRAAAAAAAKQKKHGIAQNAILQQRHRFTHCERRPL